MRASALLSGLTLAAVSAASAYADTSTSGKYMGLRVAVGPLGMGYAESQALPALEKAFSDLDIPDLSFDVNAGICTVHASVKNVKCANLKIASLTLTPKASEGITLAGTGLGVSCHADWSYKCGILKGSGSVDASVGGSTSLNAELGVTSPAPAFATQAALLQCQPKIDISSLSFHGGISSSILNLFKSELKKTLSSEIQKEMCSELTDVVKQQLNSLLAKEPFSEVSCEILDGAVVCDSNVAVGDLSGITPPSLPAPSASVLASHMVEIVVTEFPLNYALGFVHDMGILDIWITQDLLPSSLPISLNTSSFTGIAPGIATEYPNMGMQIEVNFTSPPSFSNKAPSQMGISAPLEFDFQVLSPTKGPVSAFTISCPLTAELTPSVTFNTTSKKMVLSGKVDTLSCAPVAVGTTTVGKIDDSALQGLLTLVISAALPTLNKLAATGVALPSTFGPVTLSGAAISPASGYTVLSSNITYDSTHYKAGTSFLEALALLVEHHEEVEEKRAVLTKLIKYGVEGNGNEISAKLHNALRPAFLSNPRPDFSPSVASSDGKILDASEAGLVHSNYSAHKSNTAVLNALFAAAKPGDTILIPQAEGDYYMAGGISAGNLVNVTLILGGTLRAVVDFDGWPIAGNVNHQSYQPFIHFYNSNGLQIKANVSQQGMIDGQGKEWWNRYTVGMLSAKERPGRPRLFQVSSCRNVLIENIEILNSPSWNLVLSGVDHAEVRGVTIRTDKHEIRKIKAERRRRRLRRLGIVEGPAASARRLYTNLQPEDLNTDGIDPSGKDVWIHDSAVYNDDDSIAVKPTNSGGPFSNCSQDMVIENTVLTGFGASIGSVPPSTQHNCVRNITFRNISMPHTGKGVYVKSNPTCAADGSKTSEITDITYEDITITDPLWWPVWIGPQQQQEPGSSLERKCSLFFPLDDRCPTQGCSTFTNIVLRNIKITNPVLSPGVILGNSTNPMKNIVLDGVVVENPGTFPYEKNYLCEYADVQVSGATTPVPSCKK